MISKKVFLSIVHRQGYSLEMKRRLCRKNGSIKGHSGEKSVMRNLDRSTFSIINRVFNNVIILSNTISRIL